MTGDIKGLRIAVPKEYLGEGIEEDVKDSPSYIESIRITWRNVGEVTLPHSKYASPTYYAIATAEASSNFPDSTESVMAIVLKVQKTWTRSICNPVRKDSEQK